MTLRNWVLAIAVSSTLLAADSAVVADARKKIADKKFDEAIGQLEATYKKSQAADVKKTLVMAYVAKADALMYDENLPPRTKYPTALRAYRAALKYDPANSKAKQGVSTIEGVYRSMGRPIPQ